MFFVIKKQANWGGRWRSGLKGNSGNLDLISGMKYVHLLTENKIKIRLRSDLFVMHTHEICPPLLTHPGWHLLTHAHAQGHTLIETDGIHWSGGQPFTAPVEHGGTVLCSRAPQP